MAANTAVAPRWRNQIRPGLYSFSNSAAMVAPSLARSVTAPAAEALDRAERLIAQWQEQHPIAMPAHLTWSRLRHRSALEPARFGAAPAAVAVGSQHGAESTHGP